MHFPFCNSKCNYCDFYSASFSNEIKKSYVAALCEQIDAYGKRLFLSADTLYLGGGTPVTLNADDLVKVIQKAKQLGNFEEITVEANPADSLGDTFKKLSAAGVNRISLGVQSAVQSELDLLGRRHTNEQVINTVSAIRDAGIDNISVDLMLGIPGQTKDSLKKSVEFCLKLAPQHISAYILKIEPNTAFGRTLPPDLPDEDQTADLYLMLCELLKEAGFEHYEISNFCKPGYESRHNLKYWQLKPYLGLGPGAHSFIDGKRFYFPRDIKAFTHNPNPIEDGYGGDEKEFIMLSLRLSSGLCFKEYAKRFNKDFAKMHAEWIEKLQKNGLATVKNGCLILTEQGFLLSNTIISQFIEK